LSSKLGGRRCRTCRQCPTGPPPSTSSPTSVVDAVRSTDSAPRGARHRCLVATGSHCQYPLPTPPWEALVDYHHSACYRQVISRENFSDLCGAKDSKKRNREEGIVQRDKKKSLFTKQKMSAPQVQEGALCVFRLVLEPLSYDLHSFSDADLCSLQNLLSKSLHHWL
jgi:hypothetical protein